MNAIPEFRGPTSPPLSRARQPLTRRRLSPLLSPLAACALLAGWIALSAVGDEARNFSVLIALIANFVVYTDAADLLLRLYARRRHTGSRGVELSIDLAAAAPSAMQRLVPTRPWAIVASIHDLDSRGELDAFMEAVGRYRERIWLISDGSSDQTVRRLRQAGWRCIEETVNRRKPAALRRLLEQLPSRIDTVMVIDPDCRICLASEGSSVDLDRYIGDFQASGAAAVCPRLKIEPDGFLTRFQVFEYALGFRIGRRSLADFSITSGVSLYRRDALEFALTRHSLSVYAEDLENALILLSAGERIYYDGRLIVSTEGPGSWRRWFSQRVGWYYGLLKVYTERFSEIRRIRRRAPFATYHYVIYMGLLTLGLHLVKMVAVALLLVSLLAGFDHLFAIGLVPEGHWINPLYFATAAGCYLTLGIIALFTIVPVSERGYVAPIVPLYLLYTLIHVVPMSIGFANWISKRLWGRRLYHDHYEPGERRDAAHAPPPASTETQPLSPIPRPLPLETLPTGICAIAPSVELPEGPR
jgi:glycosyltransferase involved in cell wall biosynthesis